MKTWDNGAKGKVIRETIDENFRILDTRITQLYQRYVKNFTSSDWKDYTITITEAEHKKINPIVNVFIKNGDSYSEVFGGYSIGTDNSIIIHSDITFDGRVVIE